MKKATGKKPDIMPLRRRAEDRLKEKKPAGPTPDEIDLKRLVHELQVHQIELEMQNEELTRAREEVEMVLAKYTDLYDFAPVGYFTFDEKGLISELNLTAALLLGTERAFLLNKPLSSFIQQEFQDRFYLHVQDVLGSLAKQTFDLVLKRKDGTSFDAQLESVAVTGAGRKAVWTVLTDITERRRAEKIVQESEEWLMQFFDSIPDYCYLVSPEGKIVNVNRAALEVLDYSRDELIGHPAEMIFAPKSQQKRARLFDRWLATGAVRNEEMTIRSKNGEERTVVLNVGSMRDQHGKIIHSTSIQTDITERKEMEQALRESEERFRLFFEQNNAAMLLIEPGSGTIMNANPAAAGFYGYSREELLGMNIGDINQLAPDEISLARRRVISGESVHFVFPHKRADNQIRTVEVYSTPIKIKRQTVLFSIVHDITERKNAEEEKARLETQLRRTQKLEAIGTLAGGIAHDFNNILAGILGFTEMALEDTSPDNPIYQHLELILKGGHRGRDLVKQILAFSRLNKQEQEPVVLSNIVDEALRFLRPVLPATISIKKSLLGANDTVLADPAQIHQVIMNLCANAAHAMREKGGTLELSIANVDSSDEELSLWAGLRPGVYVRLSVTDTGHGMTPEILEDIFNPFFTTKAPGEGTGLGLSVVHGILRDHGGHIAVSSEFGKGSTFHVYLPTTESIVSVEAGPLPAIQGGQERILFVDDEELLVQLNLQRLSGLGYQVFTSSNSMDALTLFEAGPDGFDLVITDYTMPNMTGIELARALLAIKPGTSVILMSGLNEKILPEKIKEAGIKAFLPKTAGKRELAGLIRRVLDTNSPPKTRIVEEQ
jgi:PAS domain S-box-containing protein